MLFHYIGKLLGSNRVGVGIELGVYVFREAKLLPRQCIYESRFFNWLPLLILMSKCLRKLSIIRYNLTNFFGPLGPRGIEFLGPLWSPARLFINVTVWSFVFVVPLLYWAIFRFRRAAADNINIGIGRDIKTGCSYDIKYYQLKSEKIGSQCSRCTFKA